jgi:hypothetical protein
MACKTKCSNILLTHETCWLDNGYDKASCRHGILRKLLSTMIQWINMRNFFLLWADDSDLWKLSEQLLLSVVSWLFLVPFCCVLKLFGCCSSNLRLAPTWSRWTQFLEVKFQLNELLTTTTALWLSIAQWIVEAQICWRIEVLMWIIQPNPRMLQDCLECWGDDLAVCSG